MARTSSITSSTMSAVTNAINTFLRFGPLPKNNQNIVKNKLRVTPLSGFAKQSFADSPRHFASIQRPQASALYVITEPRKGKTWLLGYMPRHWSITPIADALLSIESIALQTRRNGCLGVARSL